MLLYLFLKIGELTNHRLHWMFKIMNYHVQENFICLDLTFQLFNYFFKLLVFAFNVGVILTMIARKNAMTYHVYAFAMLQLISLIW